MTTSLLRNKPAQPTGSKLPLVNLYNRFARSNKDARRAFLEAIVSREPLFLLLGPTGWSTETISKLPRNVVQGLQPTNISTGERSDPLISTILAGWASSDTVALQIPLPTRMPEVSGHKSAGKAAYDLSLGAMKQALLTLTANAPT